MTSLLAIANAEAGSADEVSVAQVVQALQDGVEIELVETSTADDLAEALAGRPDVDGVVVLGGDGSLHAVIDALRAAGRLKEVVVGLIPLGTGNDFAETLALPADPVKAAEVVLAGRTREIDLIVDDEDRVVINAAHIGIGAEAARAARPWKKRLGPAGYAIGAVLTGLRGLTRPGAHLEIVIDGETLPRTEPVIQLAVGNGRFVGGGAPLLPRAEPSDGLLDLSVSYTESPRRRVAYAWHVRRGDHHQRDDVVYVRGARVTVRGEALPCTTDGELSPPATEHGWRVEPAALRMYVP
jgi:diacylglycerol kinase (ATP)